jgi:AraC-like DNA-binding protein
MHVDVLADVLSTLELRSELYFRASFRGPFATIVPAEPARIRFHIVASGQCWVSQGEDAGVLAGPGDLVLVPHGAAHLLSDAPGTSARPLADVLADAESPSKREVQVGEGEETAALVCGHFLYRRDAIHPVFAALPPLLHVRAGAGRRFDWMDALMQHLDDEVRRDEAGGDEIIRRLSEILLIEALRASLAADASNARSLGALADPQIRRVLEAIHQTPSRRWTLEGLATMGGLSRSVLSERFRALLDTTPMRYLASWRLEKARYLLQDGTRGVGEVAAEVGYASEAAFNRVFKARFGQPPGQLRRNAR